MFTFVQSLYTLGDLLKLNILFALGFLFQHFQVLKGDWIISLDQVLINVIIPCHIFVTVAETISYDVFKRAWILLLTPIVFGAAGFVVGSLFAKVLGLENVAIKKGFVITIASSNSIVVPLSVIRGISETVLNETHDPLASYGRAVVYITILSLMNSMLICVLGNIYVGDESERLMPIELDLLTEVPILPPDTTKKENCESQIYDSPYVKYSKKSDKSLIRRCIGKMKRFDGPFSCRFAVVLITLMLAILTGLSSTIRRLCFPSESFYPPFFPVIEAARSIGNTMIPLGVILLSASVYEQYLSLNSAKDNVPHFSDPILEHVTTSVIVVNLVAKMGIITLVAYILAMGIVRISFVAGDVYFILTIVLQAVIPMNLSAIKKPKKIGTCTRSISTFLLYQQMFSISVITFTVLATLILLLGLGI